MSASYANLSPAAARILRAAVDAMRPRGHGFDQPIDDHVVAEIDRMLSFVPPSLRMGFPAGLRLLEWGPLLFTGRPTRLTSMERDDARRYLEGWLESRFPPRRMLALGVRTFVVLAFYQHPDVLAHMGVRWGERMDQTVRFRSEHLDRAKYGYPRG